MHLQSEGNDAVVKYMINCSYVAKKKIQSKYSIFVMYILTNHKMHENTRDLN